MYPQGIADKRRQPRGLVGSFGIFVLLAHGCFVLIGPLAGLLLVTGKPINHQMTIEVSKDE